MYKRQAQDGALDEARRLLAEGAPIDHRDPATGSTALHAAVMHDNVGCADLLIASGAAVNVADHQGYTALAFATSFDHVPALQVLLQAGADVNVQDEFGITPLIHSAARGCAASPSPPASDPPLARLWPEPAVCARPTRRPCLLYTSPSPRD